MLEHLLERFPRAAVPRAWLAKWYVLRVSRGFVQDMRSESARALDHTHRALDNSPDGFRWNDRLYPSLSAAATAIAGSRWNGPKFFGLRRPGP